MPNRPPTHKPGYPTNPRNSTAYGAKWRGIRRRFLACNPLCVVCGRTATEVDHVDGDATHNSTLNYQALCKSCHSTKTVRENGGFGRTS